MKTQLLWTVLKGTIVGAFVGFLIGAYIVVARNAYDIRRDDFAYVQAYEQTLHSYASTIVLAFTAVFAAIGPYAAAASFGPWLRDAVYGLVCSVVAVAVTALVAANIADEQPFNMNKTSASEWIDLARNYLLPGALITGPVMGMIIGSLRRRSGRVSAVASPQHPQRPNLN